MKQRKKIQRWANTTILIFLPQHSHASVRECKCCSVAYIMSQLFSRTTGICLLRFTFYKCIYFLPQTSNSSFLSKRFRSLFFQQSKSSLYQWLLLVKKIDNDVFGSLRTVNSFLLAIGQEINIGNQLVISVTSGCQWQPVGTYSNH